MFCGHCGANNTPGNRFCHNCGQPLAAVCARCGQEIGEGNRFCPNCGQPVDAAAPAAQAPAQPTYVPPAQPTYPAASYSPPVSYVPPASAYPPPPPPVYASEPVVRGYAPTYAMAQPAFEYQGVFRRFWALVIDSFIFGTPASALMALTGGLDAMSAAQSGYYGYDTGSLWLSWLVSLGLGVVWILLEANGGTPGKRILGMRIVNEAGENIGIGKSLVRNLLRCIDALPGVIPYGLGAIMVAGSERKQCLGDRAAGTFVVRR